MCVVCVPYVVVCVQFYVLVFVMCNGACVICCVFALRVMFVVVVWLFVRCCMFCSDGVVAFQFGLVCVF